MTDPRGDQPASSGQPGPPGQPYQPQPYPYPHPPQYPYPPAQPYPQQYGVPPTPPRLRGRTPLWLALIFGVAGIVLLIVGGVVGFTQSLQKVDSFSRVSIAAGRGTARFPSAGNYVAYYEASNVSSSIHQVPLPIVTLQSPSGQIQQLDTLYGGTTRASLEIKSRLTYRFHGHNGIAIYQFHISEPGRYNVRVRATGREAPDADIAFGKSIATALAAVGAVLAGIGVLLIVVAIILLIVGLVQRSRSRKRLAAAQGYAGPPPGYGYPPPGYGYPPQQGAWPPQQPPQQ